jgi:hypothetical protein
MINQHCTYDTLFGYCKRDPSPDYDIAPAEHPVVDKDNKPMGSWFSGGHCRLDKSLCGFFVTNKELDKDSISIESHLVLFNKDGSKKEVAKKDNESKGKEKGKKKTVVVQGSLFE